MEPVFIIGAGAIGKVLAVCPAPGPPIRTASLWGGLCILQIYLLPPDAPNPLQLS
jgi:hypothetical protein